ncbi:MAG TPA: hypothetical protein PLA43_14455 [Bryobacteraceae bacterium]|nr:hypothetical protein [Bryobacteraceae bacterium]HPU73153.1 hypothetical protein [Bryobacteraceae bacterium]
MRRGIAAIALLGVAMLVSCGKKESGESPDIAAQETAQTAPGPRARVILTDGSSVPGTIVASTQTDMIVLGDDGIERKIPLSRVKSVEYGEAPAEAPARRAAAPRTRETERRPSPAAPAVPAPVAPAAPPAEVTTRTYEVPAGTEISVRTNETIDSATAQEGQTFEAQVTRDVRDANGDLVIPRGSEARIVIRSASKGGRFRGQSDLVLDMQSVTINGRQYAIETADVTQTGKAGLGANKRTATYTGGGAALGAVIGAIAGGGKGAAIGAGAGAGAGALTQILTKGGSIKVPAESVLTFQLDKPLRVAAQ